MIQILNSLTGEKILEIETLRGAYLKNANLRDSNLLGANLCGADLQGANLYRADLQGANLYSTDLRGANLKDANLRGAELRGADLRGAAICGANLESADLRGANLQDANLRDANLQLAGLQGAKLKRADLSHTDLRDTNIRFTDFSDAILDDVLWPKDLTPISPQEREQNLRTVARLALAPNSLSMLNVHTCETTHCMAGWATYALPGGSALEKKYGWEVAGFHLLGNGAARLFYASFSDARSFLEQCLVSPVDA